jgi:hypothetical protein
MKEKVSLGVSTVESNRDRDRDVLTVEMSVFEMSRSTVSIETKIKIETL